MTDKKIYFKNKREVENNEYDGSPYWNFVIINESGKI